jgi:hypothetical protein
MLDCAHARDRLFIVAYPTNSLALPDDQPRTTVRLSLHVNHELAYSYFKDVWYKLLLALKNFHKIHGTSAPECVNWEPHDWSRATKGVEDRVKVTAWDGNAMVGFVNLRPAFNSPHDSAKRVMYVEHMAAAPGNLATDLWEKRLSYVGQALLAYAVLQSHQAGFDGLLGLHAADDTALAYYEKLNSDFEGKLFFDKAFDVAAPFPIGDKARSKPYLETTPAGALELLEAYRYE